MEYTRKNVGVCSKSTRVVIEGGIIKDIEIIGGCDGNIKGLIALLKGAKADEVPAKLQEITCGNRATSCPNQIAITITEALAQ